MGDRTAVATPTATPSDPPPRKRRWPLVVVGMVLFLAGLGLVGQYVWEAYFNPVMDTVAAQQEVDQVKQEWAQGRKASAKIPGNAIALMRIPEFGADFEVAVVSGITPAALNKGVGWFEQTAQPGETGNFAVAGHRGRSGPFVPLLDLKAGARIIVETRDATFIYAITQSAADLTVDKHQTWVIDPVPVRPGRDPGTSEPAKPSKALITLITCRNFFHSPERSVAFGELIETIPKRR